MSVLSLQQVTAESCCSHLIPSDDDDVMDAAELPRFSGSPWQCDHIMPPSRSGGLASSEQTRLGRRRAPRCPGGGLGIGKKQSFLGSLPRRSVCSSTSGDRSRWIDEIDEICEAGASLAPCHPGQDRLLTLLHPRPSVDLISTDGRRSSPDGEADPPRAQIEIWELAAD